MGLGGVVFGGLGVWVVRFLERVGGVLGGGELREGVLDRVEGLGCSGGVVFEGLGVRGLSSWGFGGVCGELGGRARGLGA